MEHLPVRSYAAGIALVAMVTFTGALSYSRATARPAQAAVAASAAAKPAAPAQKSAATAKATQESAPGVSHTVLAGETLFAIARLHGADVAAIKQANGLSGDQIYPGQVLRVPGAQPVRRYTVQQGD
ncbi:MAG TPA: LysM peptidoglycan-binding domain-containing protein, partial [Symbiobacteriaceae bacterium]|nr:LysM peptidoglycan-binding domain-containing protein [Symbiobacteriaceae bacterium]